jgi:hypothetical protein
VVEEAEPTSPWPSWLLVRFRGASEHRYRVDFEMKQGRWVIRDWNERQIKPQAGKPQATPKPGGR